MSVMLLYMLDRLSEDDLDWLSRLFEMMPVRGWLDPRCSQDRGASITAPAAARALAATRVVPAHNHKTVLLDP
jgi:hypothetical protein